MIFRKLLILILLTFVVAGTSFAQDAAFSPNQELQHLLNRAEDFIQNGSPRDLINDVGTQPGEEGDMPLLDDIQRALHAYRPPNDSVDSSLRSRLREIQYKLVNLRNMGFTFNQCLEENQTDAILSGILEDDDFTGMCFDDVHQVETVDELSVSLQSVVGNHPSEYARYTDLARQMVLESRSNLLYSMFANEWQYGTAPLDTVAGRREFLATALDRICKGHNDYDHCDEMRLNHRERLRRRFNEEYPKLLQRRRVTRAAAAEEMNRQLNTFNEILSPLRFEKEGAIVGFRTPSMDNQQNIREYGRYQARFQESVQEAPGQLLFTNSMRSRVGDFKLLDRESMDGLNPNEPFRFELYNTNRALTANDVTNAVEEIDNELNRQARDLQRLSSDFETRDLLINIQERTGTGDRGLYTTEVLSADQVDQAKRYVAELLSTNPIAFAKVIMKNPDLISTVCPIHETLNQMEREGQRERQMWMWGGAIVGGALAITGIGAGIGAAVVAGTSTAASLGALGTTVAIAGGVFGAVELGYWGHETYERHREAQERMIPLLQNATPVQLEDFNDSISEMKEARTEAGWALFGVAMDVGAADVIGRVASRGFRGLSDITGNFRHLQKGYDAINNLMTPALRRAMSAVVRNQDDLDALAARLGRISEMMSPDGFARFFERIAGAGENLRIKFLEKALDSRFTPEAIKEVMEEALEIARRNCG